LDILDSSWKQSYGKIELLKDKDHNKPQKSLSLAKYLHLQLPPQEMLSHTQITVVVASVLVAWSVSAVPVDTFMI